MRKYNILTKYLIGTYCGTKIQQTMMFTHGVTMMFMTDISGSYEGFEILYAIQGK